MDIPDSDMPTAKFSNLRFPWGSAIGILALGFAWVVPFLSGDTLLPSIGLLFFGGICALTAGVSQVIGLRVLWVGLAMLSLCVLLTSIVLFFIYFFDDPPNNTASLFSFQHRGITDLVIPFIVMLGVSWSDNEIRERDIQKVYDERLAVMRGQYKLFNDGDESDILTVDPTLFGYGVIHHETCYFGLRGVTLGKFVEWTQEVSNEVEGKLQVYIATGTARLGEKTSRIVRDFVQQKSGSILVFKHRVVFFAIENVLEIASSEIKRVLWTEQYLILVCQREENPIVLRTPEPTYPWVLGAAIIRSVRAS